MQPEVRTHDIETSRGVIHVVEAGAGPAFVMLHGGGPGASGYSNYKQNLPALTQHFRVLLIDQPGFGGSYRPDEALLDEFTITQLQAEGVIEVVRALGIDKMHLLGNSLGGATALKVALLAPELVERLVLMAPGGGWLPTHTPLPTEGQKAMFRYFGGSGPSVEKMRDFLKVMIFDAKDIPDEVLEERVAASLEPTHNAFYHLLNKHFAKRGGMEPLWRDVHKIKCPTFLLWGRDDRTITLDGAYIMLKQMRDVQLHVFGKCGHWVQLERQKEFDRLVTDFLLGR